MPVNSFADKLVKKVFGSSSDIFLKKARPIVVQINEWEPKIEKLSDDELKAQTQKFKDIIPGAWYRIYAVIKPGESYQGPPPLKPAPAIAQLTTRRAFAGVDARTRHLRVHAQAAEAQRPGHRNVGGAAQTRAFCQAADLPSQPDA